MPFTSKHSPYHCFDLLSNINKLHLLRILDNLSPLPIFQRTPETSVWGDRSATCASAAADAAAAALDRGSRQRKHGLCQVAAGSAGAIPAAPAHLSQPGVSRPDDPGAAPQLLTRWKQQPCAWVDLLMTTVYLVRSRFTA